MKNLFCYLFVCGLSFCNAAIAQETLDIENTCKKYFTNLFSGDSESNARMIYPGDLEKLRSALYLPMRNALDGEDPVKKKLAKVFFSPLNGRDVVYMTNIEVFMGMQKLISMLKLDAIKAVQTAKLRTMKGFVNNSDGICNYTFDFGEVEANGSERLINYNGVWYIRLKQNPDPLGKMLAN